MKRTSSLLALLAATLAATPAMGDPQSAPTTNAPLVFKGIRGSAAGPTYLRWAPVAARLAIKRLKDIQNPNGSWGATNNQQLATAFALVAFMRNGESSGSLDYGQTIRLAHEWLLASVPKTDSERVATAIALSDYMYVHYRPEPYTESEAVFPDEEIEKLRDCIGSISPACGEGWKDLLSGSRMPRELECDLEQGTAVALWRKYATTEPVDAPSRLEDYLGLFLRGRATFHLGGYIWKGFNQEVIPKLMARMNSDGLFACTPESDRIAATGLAVMIGTVYHQKSHLFSPRIRRKDTMGDVEVKIDL
jgi:hypothetical protein